MKAGSSERRNHRASRSDVVQANDAGAELERERQSRRKAEAELQEQRRFSEALDRLTVALLEHANVEGFLQRLLALLIELTGFDVGVVRVREGRRLRARAAVGLDGELATNLTAPLDEPLGRAPGARSGEGRQGNGTPVPIVEAVPEQDPRRSAAMRDAGVTTLYAVTLLDGDELFGVAYLGAREARVLPPDVEALLCTLAPRAAAAALHLTVHESVQQAVRARDQVLNMVAHDLRNPMNIISLAANSLMQRLTDSSARRAVERIARSVQRADRLIGDLLQISMIEDGRFSIEPRLCETADLILAALESQQSLAASASVIIGADLSPELPPIEADEERILEVFENLISNAVKFTGAGGSVTVGAASQGDHILFWVKDSGCGIPPDQLPRLFDRFWQGQRKDRRGIGLGLTICKAIIDAHGGRIWADSEVDVGTTIYFALPATARRRGGARAPVEVANILLVDDRPENLLSLEAILERPEYRLVKAQSGEEALSLALRERFAVALIDVAMPGMNGLEVAVHLKELERSRDIPIIFITAFGDDPEEIHRAYSAGGADYLVKPLDAEIVRKKVAVFVDLSRRKNSGGGRLLKTPRDD